MPLKLAAHPLLPHQRLQLDMHSVASLHAYADKVARWGWRWLPLNESAGQAEMSGSADEQTVIMLTHVPLLLGRSLGSCDLQVCQLCMLQD